MIKFRKQWHLKKSDSMMSNVGSDMQPIYKLKVLDDGSRVLRPIGENNLYMEIQSHKDSCDINVILERFAKGDETALSRVQGIYGDFTEMPKTMAELSQRVIDAENMFNSLPLEVRQQFNFSASEFFASIGSEKYNAIFKEPDNLDFTASDPETGTEVTPLVGEKGVVVNEPQSE